MTFGHRNGTLKVGALMLVVLAAAVALATSVLATRTLAQGGRVGLLRCSGQSDTRTFTWCTECTSASTWWRMTRARLRRAQCCWGSAWVTGRPKETA